MSGWDLETTQDLKFWSPSSHLGLNGSAFAAEFSHRTLEEDLSFFSLHGATPRGLVVHKLSYKDASMVVKGAMTMSLAVLEAALISIVALPLRPSAVAAPLAPLALVSGTVAEGHGSVAVGHSGGREVAFVGSFRTFGTGGRLGTSAAPP